MNDRRSSDDTLVGDDSAEMEGKSSLKRKPVDYSTKNEEVELERRQQIKEGVIQEVDDTGPLKQKKTSRYALEKPHEVQGDEQDKANEVKWGDNDPEDPHQWSRGYRLWLTFICSLTTMNCTFASSAPSSATMALERQFGFDQEIAQLITATFLFGYVFGPFFWAPGSELVGRRPIFIGSLLASSLFSMADAIAQNRTTLFVCRFLAGFFAAAPLTNCGGVIADIWGPVGRGYAMTVFTACVFIGPAIGPTVGGFIVLKTSWRIIFWVIFAWSMACFILVTICLPETFSPQLLKKRAAKLRKEDPEKNRDKWSPAERLDKSPMGILHLTIIKPFSILALEPILIVITLYLSIVYALLYATFEAFPLVWEELRGFNSGQTGLIFLGILIGSLLGAAANFGFSAKYLTLTDEWDGQVPPEWRLLGSIAAGPCLIIGLFMFGWTGAYEAVPWYVPALSTVLLGASFCLLFISFLSYIVDVYMMHAASALAANTVCRSALASVFPLCAFAVIVSVRAHFWSVTVQFFENPSLLGIQWASTLLGCIAIMCAFLYYAILSLVAYHRVSLAPSPYLFFRYGAQIRKRSKFAPNLDLKKLEEKQRDEETT